MRSVTLSLALLASLPATLAANMTTTSTSYSCYTRLTTTSVATVVTRNYTVTTSTQDIGQTLTYTPLATITPNATTFTSVRTTISTKNVTVTSQLAPVIVPTRAGFVDFAAGATSVAQKPKRSSRIDIARRQGSTDNSGSQAGFEIDDNGNLNSINTNSFPFEVYCGAYVYVQAVSTTTVTASTAFTTVAAPVVTAYTTTTQTVTNTIVNILPANTVFAACGPNNVVDTWNGRGIGLVEYQPRVNVTRQRTLNATSGYDCCASCQETTDCAGALYYQNKCLITLSRVPVFNGTNGTGSEVEYCDRGSNTVTLGPVFTKEYLNATSRITVINGNCGNFFFRENIL